MLVDLLVTPTAPASPRGLYVALAACHVIAMTSAVSNPIVYGWLNSNIRREFLHLLPARCACATHRRSSNDRAKATAIGGFMSRFIDSLFGLQDRPVEDDGNETFSCWTLIQLTAALYLQIELKLQNL